MTPSVLSTDSNGLSGEDFYWLKSELNKSSDLNYEKIRWVGLNLLEKTKDMRIWSYVFFAQSYLRDEVGLIQSLKMLISDLRVLGEKLYPQKKELKFRVFTWLNQTKLTVFWENLCETASIEGLSELKQTLSELNDFLKLQYETICGSYVQLNFKQIVQQALAAKQTQRHSNQNLKSSNFVDVLPDPIAPSSATEGKLKTSQDAEEAALKLIEFHENRNEWILASAYRRALRWSDICIRADNGGKTMLLPFAPEHQAELAQFDKMLDTPQALYQRCETLFLETGGFLKWDLQFWAIQAAERFDSQLAQFLGGSLNALLTRFSGIDRWSYRDGQPFASEKTLNWLTQIFNSKKNGENPDKDEKVSCLDKPLFIKKSLQGKKNWIPLIIFESLLKCVDEHALVAWEKELAKGVGGLHVDVP